MFDFTTSTKPWTEPGGTAIFVTSERFLLVLGLQGTVYMEYAECAFAKRYKEWYKNIYSSQASMFFE